MASRTQLKKTILALGRRGKLNDAAQLAQSSSVSYPDDPDFPLMHINLLGKMEKFTKAAKAAEQALRRFPEDAHLAWSYANILTNLDRPAEAETAYRAAIERMSGADPDERAEVLCNLAEVLWELRKREEAIAAWKKALETDPACDAAREALDECLNEFAMPKSVSPALDDFHKFRQIQFDRYLASKGKKAFSTKEEAAQLIAKLQDAWNTSIAPLKEKLDTMSAAEKVELFMSVDADSV